MARATRPRSNTPEPRPIQRGAVWRVNLDPTHGSEIRKTRPGVVLSADALNRVRRTVVIVPLSTGPAPKPPIVVAVRSAGPESVAVCDQIRAVDKARFVRMECTLSTADLHAIEAGVREVLQL
jgi:mRNA interferase MazF